MPPGPVRRCARFTVRSSVTRVRLVRFVRVVPLRSVVVSLDSVERDTLFEFDGGEALGAGAGSCADAAESGEAPSATTGAEGAERGGALAASAWIAETETLEGDAASAALAPARVWAYVNPKMAKRPRAPAPNHAERFGTSRS